MLRLKIEREKRNLTRIALARAARIGESNYGVLERGLRQPWAPEIARLGEALQWLGDPHELFEEVPDAERP